MKWSAIMEGFSYGMKIDLTKNHNLSNLNPKPDKMVENW